MLADNIDALDNATRAQQARDDGAPTLVASGRFRVVAELGRGAYGVVYRAVDNELDRPVALKVLPRRRAAAEILREARILARLNHPNVVTIYDVGRTRELDFVAMELVEGVTLRHWMGEAHSAAERLTVVCAAGAGLAAAHGQQVVHGDFKPENVMVGADGRVRVLDFGMARTITTADNDAVVRAGLRGTPAYMAPEQWDGKRSSPRSDQFAFCVTLWEALYGQRPFTGESLMELALAVTRGALPRPRAMVRRSIHRALRRGLAVDPGARWPEMRSLLRALQGRRTRRVVVVGAAVVAVALGVGVGRSTTMASYCEPRALADSIGAQLGAGVSSPLRAAIDGYAREWEAAHQRVCRSAASDDRVAQLACLERSRVSLTGVVDALSADTLSPTSARRSVERLRRVERCEDASFVMTTYPAPEQPERRALVEELRMRTARAVASAYASQPADVDDTLRGLVVEARQLAFIPLEIEIELARLHHAQARLRTVGSAGRELQMRAIAEGLWLHAVRATTLMIRGAQTPGTLELAEALAAHLPPHLQDRELLPARIEAARVHIESGRYDRAREILELCRATVDQSFRDTPQDFELVLVESLLRWRQGSYDEGAAMLEARLVDVQRELGEDSGSALDFLIDLSAIERNRGNMAEAITLMEESVRRVERVDGPDAPRLALILNNLGLALTRLGRLDEAERALLRAGAIWLATYSEDHVQLAFAYTNLGDVYTAMGRLEDAERYLDKALKIREGALGEQHPFTAYTRLSRARLCLALGRLDAAVDDARAALSAREKLYDEDAWLIAEARVVLARALARRGELAEARSATERARVELAAAKGDAPSELHAELARLVAELEGSAAP